MHTIWKIQLITHAPIQDVLVPEDAELLKVSVQHGKICVWFKCNPSNPVKPHRIMMCLTGDPIPELSRYVDTLFLDGGDFILHVFE